MTARQPPPVNLLLLPARQLHGELQLLVEAGRHAEGTGKPRVGGGAVGERRVGGRVLRGHGGGQAGVGRVFSLSAGQRDGERLLDRPERRQKKLSKAVVFSVLLLKLQ